MKNKKRYLLRETSHKFLFEQDEEATAEEDIFGGDEEEPADEGDEAPEGGGEAATGDESPAEEEAKEVSVSPEEQYKLSDSIDTELDALLVDFEEEARKSAVVNKPTELGEVLYRRLFESAADDIDLRSFASNVARLVRNYQNLIDWHSVILNKAESFVNNHYGEDTVSVLFDILDEEYGITRKAKEEEPVEEPVAVGARGEGGG